MIDRRGRTVYGESGVPGWRRRGSVRAWQGDACLRLTRVKPYSQSIGRRITWRLIERGRGLRVNDGTCFHCCVEFCDEGQCLRLGQFGSRAGAERFVERTAHCLGLSWRDETATVREA